MNEIEKHITTLIEPEEYKKYSNQVFRISTSKIYVLKKKFTSGKEEVIEFPMSECVCIEGKIEKPIFKVILGYLLIALLIGIVYGIYYYWGSFEPGTHFKIAPLVLALGYGISWATGTKRHQLIFTMNNGEKLLWASASGSFNHKENNVAKVINFAKEKGIYKVA